MKVFLVILSLFFVSACSKKPETVAEKFLNKILVERNFNDAYEMLSSETKKDTSKAEFLGNIEKVLEVKRYSSLYDFEAKRRDLKILSIDKNSGDLVVEIKYSAKRVKLFADFFDQYSSRSKELGVETEDAEKIFDDKYLAELATNGYGQFFEVEDDKIHS